MKNQATSLELSPAEIKNKDFKKTMLGYSPEEVVGFLDQVAKLWEKVQKREKDLFGEIEQLRSDLKGWESKQQKAEAEAAKIIQEAETRSNEIRRNTESWLAAVVQEVEEVEKRKANFITAFQSALDSHYEILKKEQGETDSLTLKLHDYLKNPKSVAGKESAFPS